MTADRARLADLARRVPDGTFKASVTHNTGSPTARVVIECPPELWAFIETATPETVLALLADLDMAEKERAEARARASRRRARGAVDKRGGQERNLAAPAPPRDESYWTALGHDLTPRPRFQNLPPPVKIPGEP